MTLNTPPGVLLCAWAADETKRLTAEVVYLDADGGGVLLTLGLAAAYCIGYHEHFYASPGQGARSYTCYVALVDPDGFTLTPGSARAYMPAAPRDHGRPPVALEQETGADLTSARGFSAASGGIPSTGLAAVLEKCIQIKQPQILDPEADPHQFRNTVIADLEQIYATPTGQKMLEALAKSGKKVSIEYTWSGNAIGGYDVPEGRFLQADGPRGIGTNSKVAYHPSREKIGHQLWDTRPPALGLAYELIHAEQAAYGRMRPGRAKNGPIPKPPGTDAKEDADIRELEAVGVPPHDKYPFTENKLRAEWRPPQPFRERY